MKNSCEVSSKNLVHLLPKTRGIKKIFKSVRCAKEKSSVQFYNKISVQLLPTCLDVLLKEIKFPSEQCS